MKHFKMLAASLSLCMLAQSLWLVPLSATAEAAETTDTTEEIVTVDASSSELFLPESYEQYLPLENPTDVALFGDHIAVADENRLYVFDGSTYRMYTHIRENAGGEYDSSISKISFDENGTLYFADRDLSLYTLPYEALSEEELQPQETDIKNCSTFCIAGDKLFIATVSNTETTINAYPLNRLVPGSELLVNSEKLLPLTPYMAYAGGKLYCATDTRVTAYTYTDGKYVALYNSVLDSTSSVNGLSALTALGDSFYYTVKGVSGANGLYQTDLQGHSVLQAAGEDYVALTANGDDLYCIQGSSIKKLDVSGGAATETGYEITSASSSFNRLNGATEVVRAKNLVVIADRINCRISVYNTVTEKYTLIPCTDGEVKYLPEYIATDGDIIGVSSENNVFVYTKNSAGEYALTTKCTPPNIVSGIACVYGKCYFVTKGFGYGLASDDFDPSDICTRDRTET
ncbi:MAG: hypothetical protein K2L87_03140, partial [Clostridiales bacterium]|nr:hypothetical protein [Clostridiales bacterium]